jgi:hypothetical protein
MFENTAMYAYIVAVPNEAVFLLPFTSVTLGLYPDVPTLRPWLSCVQRFLRTWRLRPGWR